MKKRTQTATEIDTPQDRACLIFEKVFIALLLIGLCVGTGVILGKIANGQWLFVACHECGHIVKKNTATEKKQFKKLVGRDDKFQRWWYCGQHRPAWDYAVHDRFFKGQMDLECETNGNVLTNVDASYMISIGTNNITTWAIITNGIAVGGSLNTKHIDY